MAFFLAFPHSGSHLAEGWETQSSVANGEWKTCASPGPVFQSGERCGRRLRAWRSFSQDVFHWQIMDGNLTGNIRKFLPIVGEGSPTKLPPGLMLFLMIASFLIPCPSSSVPRACAGGTGPRPRGARQLRRAGLFLPVPAARR